MIPRAAQILVAALVLATTTIPPLAHADWVNLTGAETSPNIAEITVLDDRVRVALEVYIGDIGNFEALLPDMWLQGNTADRPSQSERLQKFATEGLQIVTDDGTKLPVELKLAEPRQRKDRFSPFAGTIDPATRRQLPAPPEDKRVLYVELEYPFPGKPQHLTFIPPLNEKGKPKVTIGFIAYHKAVPITDFRYLAQGERLMPNWEDPWYTEFINPKLNRHHKSALMTFLYLEPREVRHEVLIRIRDLQEWTDLRLSAGALLDSVEQAQVKERACAFFAAHNPLTIDGTPVKSASARVEFLDLSLTGVLVIEDARPLDPKSAILGVILSYPVKHLPQQVIVKWELFNERLTQIPATATDPAGPFPSVIDADDPTFVWHNYLRNFEDPQVSPVVIDAGRSMRVPVLSVLLLVLAFGAVSLAVRPVFLSRKAWLVSSGVSVVAAVLLLRVAVINVPNPLAGPPDAVTATQILSGVLANVNHAYVEKNPDALHQALQVVIAPDALTDVQAELDRSLAIKVAGGGIARVETVENVAIKDIAAFQGRTGFRGVAEWTAKASAGHWGHTHQRTIRFRALVELVNDQGSWKLAGITVTDARQEM